MSTPDEHDFVPISESLIQDKILHTLSIWPKISPSMLQVGIGTAISPKMWHPIFDKLLRDGQVIKEEVSGRGPTGRDQTYTVISLAQKDAPKLGSDGDDSKALANIS